MSDVERPATPIADRWAFTEGMELELSEDSLAAAGNTDARTGEEHTGAMVAAYPSDPGAFFADMETSLPVEERHVTILFMGTAADLNDAQVQAAHAAAQEAASVEPFDARISGVGVLGDDTPRASVLYLEHPAFEQVRSAVWGGTEGTHDAHSHPHFTPHMTIDYGRSPDDLESMIGDTIPMGGIRVAMAGEVTDYPFGGDS